MSMPPSGVEGLMDEQAVIEAEIQLELENINLDDEVPLDNDLPDDEPELEEDLRVDDELEGYIKRLQDQSNRFEQELLECDELLSHTTNNNESVGNALIPYEDQTLLMQLAKEQGYDVEEYRKKILEEIENDEVTLEDEVADLIGEVGVSRDGEQCSLTEYQDSAQTIDAGLPVKIEKAVEEGIIPDEVPVSQELVLMYAEGDGPANMRRDLQNMLREQLESLENKYQQRIDKIKKDEAYRRDEEEVREKRMNEERQWKLQEIQRQEQEMIVEREIAEREIQREQDLAEKEMQENMKKFQEEMAMLEEDMNRQKKEHAGMVEMERRKHEENQQKAVVTIQSTYRGYRIRKQTRPLLDEKKEVRKKEKEEQRIKEVEIEIERRKEEKEKQEEIERQKVEEEKRQKEELKRQKEEEKKRLEEEKRKRKEEEERIKQEEKMRKEEEKQRKEEEKQRKKEEERKRKEEEKKKKEEEEQRKREEKRLKEEEEKRRKEEEKLKKEEEKKRKEEEKRLKEEENRKEKERQLEEERKKKEEIEMKEEMKNRNEDREMSSETLKGHCVDLEQADDGDINGVLEDKNRISENNDLENHKKEVVAKTKCDNDETLEDSKHNIEGGSDHSKPGNDALINASGIDPNISNKVGTQRPKTPRSARTPRTPRPSTARKEKTQMKNEEKAKVEEKNEVKVDILPNHLEALRLKFMKECLPWSKVSNEPWKLKSGVSKKPLRRPSSAKKLPLLSEDVVIQAARVASLKMVTTVELKDLPGHNMSLLGQCGGLRYLTLTNCNLVAIEGLGQCRQLQYINVQGNKIEYVDLKDVGQLQYLNLSHNKLSSIHGLDNCTSLRWLDFSHNNITRLGGIDALRRLHTLKLSHNQLISTQGLGATPTLQMLDVSHNHLQALEDLNKLCLLFSLNACSNNLLQVPSLDNQVLLLELFLSDNSISSLSGLAAVWLPLLSTLYLQQNSLSELPLLQNCLLLRELNLSDNQISDLETVQQCVAGCFYLEQLHLEENPVYTDLDERFISKLKCTCPRLTCHQDSSKERTVKLTPVKPRNSYETMCFTQTRAMKDVIGHFEQNINLCRNGSSDHSQISDVHYKFCDRTFTIAVEYRYAHEYGDISVAMPTAPTGPKSGRPLSARQKEKFSNPKEMFENALKSTNSDSNPKSIETLNEKIVHSDPKDMFTNALKSQAGDRKASVEINHINKNIVSDHNTNNIQSSYAANPRDLFEQALKSADKSCSGKGSVKVDETLLNGQTSSFQHNRSVIHTTNNTTNETKKSMAATTIQSAWRGYMCRKQLLEQAGIGVHVDPVLLEKITKSAVVIQASWRGYILRKKLLAALEYAQFDFDEEDDEDAMDMGDEFDLDKFVDIDQDLLDTDWKPPDTPEIPTSYAVLKKPPSGKPKVPPINTADGRPPSNPRRAWRNMESPLSDLGMGKIPRPPSSVASTELTMRSGVSRKEERLAEEWGFKDTGTAHLMMQRAKKMKYNAERRKKISKLDPKQRLALFKKLEEVIHPPTHTVPQRKTLPRKEYFQARQDEIHKQEQEKRQEYHNRASRTFEWLHTQVGDHVTSDSVINPGHSEGPKYVPLTENNLPELLNGGKRVQLVSSPMSVDLQSVDSVSTLGQKPRRFSAGSGPTSSKLPPIQPSSAPSQAPHLKERMSFRNPKVNQSVGWGGGKKRSK